jgi:catechol 2,3-dioxygenase-like lactoylglutathione lyase family enzyme
MSVRPAAAVLRHVLLLQRDVRKAAHFYSEGLGLTVNVCTERWAELQSGGTRLGLKGVDGSVRHPGQPPGCRRLSPACRFTRCDVIRSLTPRWTCREASVTAGYTPFLSFAVADISGTVARCLELGAVLDGPIKYRVHGARVAALRAPDGHMLGLVEEA